MEQRQSTARLGETAETELGGVRQGIGPGGGSSIAAPPDHREAPRPLQTLHGTSLAFQPPGENAKHTPGLFYTAPVPSEGSYLHTPKPLQVTLSEGGEFEFGFIF